MPSVHEQLSERFYKWETRGRGWQVYSDPVYPEPPFQPFVGHYLPDTPIVDDGRRPTFLSSLFRKISQPQSPPVAAEIEAEEESEPQILVRDSLVELQASLPAKLDIPKEAFEQFLSNISLCREPITFELLGTPQRVVAQFATHADDAPLMRRQLRAYFPEVVFQAQPDALEGEWDSSAGHYTAVFEFGLEREFMYPLASGKLDPFVGIIGALSELQPGEIGLFQVLFQPVQNKWTESITRAVTHADGKPFFVNMPELTGAAENKIARPLYAAVVRILVRSETSARTGQLSRDLGGSLRVFINPQGNALVPLANDEYPFEEHMADVICRQSRRSGMLLNTDELIGFVHLPSSDVRSPVLQRQIVKTKAAPTVVRQNSGLLLGNNSHAGESIPVRLTPAQRVQHTHIIGASGTGKSTLLFNLIRQDIERGQGVAVLDPAGDLVDRILGVIPPGRIKDVILVDPADEEYSIGFNILSAHSQIEKTLLTSDLVSLFRRLTSTSWGDQMGSVLQNAILAFLENSRQGTIADMQRFLAEKAFRAEFLKTVQAKSVSYYWNSVFPLLHGDRSIPSLVTRLGAFLNHPPIRNMVSQRENRLDFADIMDTGKIFLAKLPEGTMGEEDSHLLGALMIAKFQQIALGRQAQQMETRKDFWIYVDEFDHFITPSMAKLLKSTRKYRIGLTLAHHTLQQLQRDSDVASAVMAHPMTRIVFRVSNDDARKLADGFSFFESQDFTKLETFQAVARVERSDYDFNLSVLPLKDSDEAQAEERRQEVRKASRETYGTPRARIEAALDAEFEVQTVQAESPKPKPVAPTIPKDSEATPGPHIADIPTSKAALEYADLEESDHSAIKNQIRAEAESLDYTVALEKQVLNSQERIDAVLERGKRLIACEISVTNTVEYEAVQNITKCLRAGYVHVASICASRKKLTKIQERFAEVCSPDQIAMVGFYTPDEFLSKIFDWAQEDPEGGKAEQDKPRIQKIGFDSAPPTEAERAQCERESLAALRKKLKR